MSGCFKQGEDSSLQKKKMVPRSNKQYYILRLLQAQRDKEEGGGKEGQF